MQKAEKQAQDISFRVLKVILKILDLSYVQRESTKALEQEDNKPNGLEGK